MSDLVERLNKRRTGFPGYPLGCDLVKDIGDAADEIEQLKAIIAGLQRELMLGPVHERLSNELLDPIIDRTFAICQRAGILPEQMSDLIERLRHEYCDEACEKNRFEAADEIKRLKAELFTMRNVFHQQDAEIERLRAVVDAARHLLAGGDKEAVYHLEKALAALEDK
jgi:hypothetical protein